MGADIGGLGDVIIGVGPIAYDIPGKFKEPNQLNGVIVDCMMHNAYVRQGQTYMASLASATPYNGATVGFFRLGGPTLLWLCEWTSCMMTGNNHPPIPDPTPPPGWVLLDVQAELAMVSIGPSGFDAIFRISGQYVYGCLNPSTNPLADMAYPQAPWVNPGTIPRLIPASALDPFLKHPLTGGLVIGGKPIVRDNGQGLTPPDAFL